MKPFYLAVICLSLLGLVGSIPVPSELSLTDRLGMFPDQWELSPTGPEAKLFGESPAEVKAALAGC